MPRRFQTADSRPSREPARGQRAGPLDVYILGIRHRHLLGPRGRGRLDCLAVCWSPEFVG